MKDFLGIITIIMAFAGYAPYIKDTFTGKTKPHIVSWFLWTFVSFLAFGLQWSKGAGAGSYVNFAMGIICLVLFLAGIRNGTKEIRKIDIVFFVLAIAAIILWLAVDQPVLSILLVTLIDAISFAPTIIKSWTKPWQETLFTWFFNSLRHGLSILSLSSFNFVTVLFPSYALIACSAFCILLVIRRKVVKKT